MYLGILGTRSLDTSFLTTNLDEILGEAPHLALHLRIDLILYHCPPLSYTSTLRKLER